MTHPSIKRQQAFDGFSQHQDVDPDAYRTFSAGKFALQSPQERFAVLENIDAHLGSDDGTSLKAKSQLLQMRQHLSRTHENLLKLNR